MAEAALTSGIVVEEVAPRSSAEEAGIRAGDVVASWSRPAAALDGPPARGELRSPFDLTDVEVEQGPRAPVTLSGMRGLQPAEWVLSRSPFGLTVRPVLEGDLLTRYEEGRDLVRNRKVAEGAERWRAAAAAAAGQGRPVEAVWLLARAGRALADLGSWEQANAAYDEISKTGGALLGPGALAAVLREWAAALGRRNDWTQAESQYQKALALDQARAPETLSLAATLNSLGQMAWRREDLAGSETYHRRALAIRERLAPGSLELAATLNDLGNVAWSSGQLDVAQREHQRSLEIRRRVAPESLAVAGSLNALGMVAGGRGDLAAADDFQLRSLAIKEKLAPESLTLANTLNNLAVNATERGDPEAAEEYVRRALPILEKVAPVSREIVGSLNHLGILAKDREGYAETEKYYRRALAIAETLAPEGSSVAQTLGNLGNLGIDRNDLASAEDYLRRAQALFEKMAPGSVEVAWSLISRGEVALKRGDLEAAEKHYGQSLALTERLAPGSAYHATSLNGLGLTHRRAGRLDRAVELLTRALDTIESQKTRLGGTQEARAGFTARYTAFYHECLETLIEAGRPGDALHVLERSRATALLALFAERDLVFAADLPAELSRERKLADAEYDRVQAQLARPGAGSEPAENEALLSRLRALRQTQEEIAVKIRKASPRLASVQYPEPLELRGVRSALDRGSVLLAYSVGEEKTILFVVQSDAAPGPGLIVRSLPIGAKALRRKVEAFRAVIEQREEGRPDALAGQASELYDLLLRPAEPQIAASQRLVISPDGPLHSLPFAALRRKDAGRRGSSYLVEWKPFHTVASATVYAELKKARRPSPSSGVLVAFGDPRYPALSKESSGEVANADVRSLVRRGYQLAPLPASREEVEAIAGLFPGVARTYLGEQATEERAKAIEPDARYVHFACHGYLDERFPLNSALALTIPEHPAEGQENGLLQAWEVFERVRISADLVVLSACETGLGKEMGGEGLLGLTRAFHYAGARSVLGSLWAVADESTAVLMKRFYGRLADGRGRDQALRAAQMSLIRTTSRAHPFHWAGFQLSGDWK